MASEDMTVGGFHAHFKSKDALVADAVDRMFSERYAMFRACRQNADLHRRLRL